MAPGHAVTITWYPAATIRQTTVLIAKITCLAIWIVFSSTCFNISLTKPCVTRMVIIRLWTTIRTFCIARTINGTSIMFYPTIPHALNIMITSVDALIHECVTDMFAFHFILWIPEKFSVKALLILLLGIAGTAPAGPKIKRFSDLRSPAYLIVYLRAFIGWRYCCYCCWHCRCRTSNNFI